MNNIIETIALAGELCQKYQVPVLPVSCMELDEDEIKRILAQLLFEFPIKEINVDIPKWVLSLPKDNPVKNGITEAIKLSASKIEKIRKKYKK